MGLFLSLCVGLFLSFSVVSSCLCLPSGLGGRALAAPLKHLCFGGVLEVHFAGQGGEQGWGACLGVYDFPCI